MSGSGFSNPIVGGGGGLVYPSIHSPGFNVANPPASPNPSWGILKSGLAYFFGLILSGGTITGPNYIINSNGWFFYGGTPANGNLVASFVGNTGGTDQFGNTYQPGDTVYTPNGGYVNITPIGGIGGNTAVLLHPGLTAHVTLNPQIYGGSFRSGLVNEQEILVLSSGAAGGLDDFELQLFSESADATGGTFMNFIGGGSILSQLFKTQWNIGVAISATLGTTAIPTVITTDSWHSITLDPNWSTLAGQPVPSVQLMSDGMVHTVGAAQFNVNLGVTNLNGNNPIAAVYRPITGNFIAAARGSAGIEVQTNGVIVSAVDAGQNTVFCNFNGRYPKNL
jgi:hypothetical protein